MGRLIDVMHQGLDRVIGAWELDGLIVDPGPEPCLEALLEGLGGVEPRALMLTHIHLDHAGASGALVERFPSMRVYVHERGAPHMADPSRLLASAERLYGDDMERLWGRVLPVPERNIVALSGGENVQGLRVEYTPGHASHHVSYLDESSGDAYVGDVAGVRIPPAGLTVTPTPPPDIDLEAWGRSLDAIAAWEPTSLRLTHFGEVQPALEQIDAIRDALRHWAERARRGDREGFLTELRGRVAESTDPETAERYECARPPEQSWLGLERYWARANSSMADAE